MTSDVFQQRLILARIYSYLSLLAYAAVLASQILGVIVTFTDKTDVIASCTAYYTGASATSGSWWSSDDNFLTPMTAQQAAAYCQRLWSSSKTWDIIWLFVSAIVGAFFVMFSFAYVRQLLDPSSVKERVSRFANHQTHQPPYDPAGAFTYPPQTADTPYAPYAPPPGPPPAPHDPFRDPRPGSSRNVAMHSDDEDDVKKRDSGETLRGDEPVKKTLA